MTTAKNRAEVVVASNRGPLSFERSDDGTLQLERGGGGLVSGLSRVAADSDVVWICAALSDGDRIAARRASHGRIDRTEHDTAGMAVRMLDIDRATFARAYNGVANSALWFVHHMLYDTPTRPWYDAKFRRQWSSYEAYNRAFADALAEDAHPGAKVIVQDYHLSLVPAMLRERRPDLAIAHFSHTPWSPPDYYRMLPDHVARAVLEGILGADHAGFLSPRWARLFLDCCEAVLGARVDHEALTVEHAGRTVQLGIHALGVDADELLARAGERDVRLAREELADAVGDRLVIGRVDRTELSKNIVRGLAAYRELLRTQPEWHGRVVHIASVFPSREDLPEYREYTGAVQRLGQRIDDEFGTPEWEPLILTTDRPYPYSLAVCQLTHVGLINSIRDGMNLVAKELPLLSQPGCTLVLSRETGAYDEMGEASFVVNPFDVSATARALHEALLLDDGERRARSDRLSAVASALPPQQWFADQLDALD